MVRIAPINLNFNPKTLWFDAGDLDVCAGDGVVVTTARGTEFGRANGSVFEADAAQIKKLKSPLKPVERLATEEDEIRAIEMERASAEALPIFKQMAAETSSDMHPVSVEYLFDGDKAIFYFEAEERVDFRDLVRKLAAYFHVRIDMRQIGVRDEARMVGGLGHCGQELCCKRLGGEFCPVSIRMAKEQDLSLNPQKISGVCGRLMCCLRYEFDAYKDFKSRAPKQNSQVETPIGTAKVIDLDVPREIVTLRVDGEKPVKVPLADFDAPLEGNRPKVVGEDAWESATAEVTVDSTQESSIFATAQLTGHDKLADPSSVRRSGRGAQKSHTTNGSNTTSAKQASSSGGHSGTDRAVDAPSISNRKPRKRRSTKVGGSAPATDGVAEAQKRRQAQDNLQQKKQASSGKQKSQPSQGQQKNQAAQGQKRKSQGPSAGKKQSSSRSGGAAQNGRNNQNSQGAQGGRNAQGNQNAQNVRSSQNTPKKQGRQSSPDAEKTSRPRPGQKSSGLRQRSASQSQSQQKPDGPSSYERRGSAGEEGKQGNEGAHRRTRRRSHTSTPKGGEGASAGGTQAIGDK